jgi:hypothetical protein
MLPIGALLRAAPALNLTRALRTDPCAYDFWSAVIDVQYCDDSLRCSGGGWDCAVTVRASDYAIRCTRAADACTLDSVNYAWISGGPGGAARCVGACDSGLSAGAIAGICLGALGFLVLVGVAAYCCAACACRHAAAVVDAGAPAPAPACAAPPLPYGMPPPAYANPAYPPGPYGAPYAGPYAGPYEPKPDDGRL